jgi:hypothetical protein
MAQVDDFVLQLEDSIVSDDEHVEPAPAPGHPAPGHPAPGHPAPAPAVQVGFHQVAVVRNFTKFELEGSPTVWFDEFNKVYHIYFSF